MTKRFLQSSSFFGDAMSKVTACNYSNLMLSPMQFTVSILRTCIRPQALCSRNSCKRRTIRQLNNVYSGLGERFTAHAQNLPRALFPFPAGNLVWRRDYRAPRVWRGNCVIWTRRWTFDVATNNLQAASQAERNYCVQNVDGGLLADAHAPVVASSIIYATQRLRRPARRWRHCPHPQLLQPTNQPLSIFSWTLTAVWRLSTSTALVIAHVSFLRSPALTFLTSEGRPTNYRFAICSRRWR